MTKVNYPVHVSLPIILESPQAAERVAVELIKFERKLRRVPKPLMCLLTSENNRLADQIRYARRRLQEEAGLVVDPTSL